MISKLKTIGYISDSKIAHINNHNSFIPKFYVLLKIHKQENLLRSIVSCIGAPIYKQAKFGADKLSKAFVEYNLNIQNE